MNATDVHVLRRRNFRRHLRLLILLGLAVFAMMAVRVLLGQYTVTIPDFFRILGGERIPGATFIVMQDKLPRALLGAAAGLAFGISGALFRSVLRNPLASPDVLGINAGAAAGAVAAMYFWGAAGSGLAWSGLAGALTAAGLIAAASTSLRSGTGRSGIVGERFLLAGIGVAALAQAVVVGLMARLTTQSAQSAAVWTVGSLNSSTWDRLVLVALVLLVAVPSAVFLHQALRPASLGTELAVGLGSHPGAVQTAALALGVVLAAVATAATGPLAFVALLSTPIAAALRGGKISVLASGAIGALIVVAADMVGAEMFGDTRLPAGVVTGAIGAPVMLWLLVQMRRGRQS
ncbi:FecCD family ABC transporter permease [Kocuria sp.]|uniref:FecCD family ABC transporter permease n=1 Tax=Kocuria sp. TaxID=1871328 RepID=UPI0026DEF7AA|nr:iron ABC transporter permease [Kocuria sp.]MDO5618684.1 iron ABC transporter permease [Kocuria sp.]